MGKWNLLEVKASDGKCYIYIGCKWQSVTFAAFIRIIQGVKWLKKL